MPLLSAVIPSGKILYIQTTHSQPTYDGPRDKMMQIMMNLEREFIRLERELMALYDQDFCCQLHAEEYKADITLKHANLAVLQRRLDQEARNFQIFAANEKSMQEKLSFSVRQDKAMQTELVDASADNSQPFAPESPTPSQTPKEISNPEKLNQSEEPKITSEIQNDCRFNTLSPEKHSSESDCFSPSSSPSQKSHPLSKPATPISMTIMPQVPRLLQNSSPAQTPTVLGNGSSPPDLSLPHHQLLTKSPPLSFKIPSAENRSNSEPPESQSPQKSLSPQKIPFEIHHPHISAPNHSDRQLSQNPGLEPKPPKEQMQERNSESGLEPPDVRLSLMVSHLRICDDRNVVVSQGMDENVQQIMDKKVSLSMDEKMPQDPDQNIPQAGELKIFQAREVRIAQDMTTEISENRHQQLSQDLQVHPVQEPEMKILHHTVSEAEPSPCDQEQVFADKLTQTVEMNEDDLQDVNEGEEASEEGLLRDCSGNSSEVDETDMP